MKKPVVWCLALVGFGALLPACTTMVVGGAVSTAAITSDPRTTGTIVDDHQIESKTKQFFDADGLLSQQAHIVVTCFNGIVLLAGQTPTDEMRTRAEDYVKRVSKVRNIHNEITIEPPTPTFQRTNDGLITTKVKGKLFAVKDLNSGMVKVVTENGVVYLMGVIDKATGDAVAEVVAGLSGVQKVVKLFEPTGKTY